MVALVWFTRYLLYTYGPGNGVLGYGMQSRRLILVSLRTIGFFFGWDVYSCHHNAHGDGSQLVLGGNTPEATIESGRHVRVSCFYRTVLRISSHLPLGHSVDWGLFLLYLTACNTTLEGDLRVELIAVFKIPSLPLLSLYLMMRFYIQEDDPRSFLQPQLSNAVVLAHQT